MKLKYTVGIIGNGRFGSMLYKTFDNFGKSNFEVFMYSRNPKKDRKRYSSLESICKLDIIIPAVPISAYEGQIKSIKHFVTKSTLIVDVCSVNIYPSKILKENLDCDLLSTHPMFGPDSTKDANEFKNLKFIYYPLRIRNNTKYNIFLEFWRNLGCELIRLTPKEHDEQAAYTHSFAFLVGKLGIMLNIRKNDILTKGFEGIMYNQEAVENDSSTLFNDLFRFNPYSKKMLKQFIINSEEIYKKIFN